VTKLLISRDSPGRSNRTQIITSASCISPNGKVSLETSGLGRWVIYWKHRISVRLIDARPAIGHEMFPGFCRRVALTCGSHRIVDIRLETCDNVCSFAREGRVIFSYEDARGISGFLLCRLLQYPHDLHQKCVERYHSLLAEPRRVPGNLKTLQPGAFHTVDKLKAFLSMNLR
jgi:hypothetical protein